MILKIISAAHDDPRKTHTEWVPGILRLREILPTENPLEVTFRNEDDNGAVVSTMVLGERTSDHQDCSPLPVAWQALALMADEPEHETALLAFGKVDAVYLLTDQGDTIEKLHDHRWSDRGVFMASGNKTVEDRSEAGIRVNLDPGQIIS